MSARAPRYFVIDGKRHLWRDVLQRRREQRQDCANAVQPALFELRQDRRPPARPHGSRAVSGAVAVQVAPWLMVS
jgi:hypothetical protein